MKTSRELIEKHCGRGLNERLVNIELSREGMPNYVWERPSEEPAKRTSRSGPRIERQPTKPFPQGGSRDGCS